MWCEAWQAPRRGGRRLWRWPFTEFCEMELRAA